MGDINVALDSWSTNSKNTSCMVEALKLKYTKEHQYNQKSDSGYISFPKHYFVDLKFFLERDNMEAVMVLISLIEEFPFRKPVGKCELREFKNGTIVFMTLFVNTIVEVFGDLDCQVSALNQFIEKIEETDHCDTLKNLILETMKTMVRRQKETEDFCCHSVVVHRALKIIRRDFREKIKLQSLAEELSISENYLSKCLKKETGKGFKDHIHEIRIEEAKQYLMKTDASMYDIAISVGFNYQNHFASVFRKYVGMTPMEYRNQHFR